MGAFFDIWSEIGEELFLPNHEAHGQNYHLPRGKLAPTDEDSFTGYVFSFFVDIFFDLVQILQISVTFLDRRLRFLSSSPLRAHCPHFPAFKRARPPAEWAGVADLTFRALFLWRTNQSASSV